MKKLFLLLCVFGCLGLLTQCQDQAEPVDDFLLRWYPTNQGTQPYGDLYRFDQLPTCPSGYHVPTVAELSRLETYLSVWGTGSGGVNGRWFCPTEATKDNPSTDNGCVFFPAAGSRYVYSDGTVYTNVPGTGSHYWSSTPNESNPSSAYALRFYSDYVGVRLDYWRNTDSDGVPWWSERSVRCVR